MPTYRFRENEVWTPKKIITVPIMVPRLVGKPLDFELVLDTGAEKTLIDSSIIQDIGFNSDAGEPVSYMGAGGAVLEARRIYLVEISVLGCSWSNVEVYFRELSAEEKRYNVKGYLGLNFLEHFKLYIDFPAGVLELSDS